MTFSFPFKKKTLFISAVVLAVVFLALLALLGTPYLRDYLDSRQILANPELKDYYLTIKDRRKTIKAEPDNWDAYLSIGFNWKSIGDQTGESKYYQKAVGAYEKAISRFGMQGYVAYLNAGNLYRQLGEYLKAEDRYKKAIEIDPGEPRLYLALIDLYRHEMQKSEDEIIDVYKYALSRLVESGPVIVDYAAYLREIGRIRDALMYYNLLARSWPDSEEYKKIADELRAELAEGQR